MFVTLLLTSSCFAQDLTMSITDLRGCSASASEYAGCSGESNMGCMCDTSTYLAALVRCVPGRLGYTANTASIWSEIDTEISTICSSHRSIAEDFCGDCLDSALSIVSCSDNDDLACVCGSPDDFQSAVTSCTQSHRVGTTSCPDHIVQTWMSDFYTCENRNSYMAGPGVFDGCVKCQAAVALSLGCTGENDYDCLCSEGDHTDQLSSCIEASCYTQDQTIAQNKYNLQCQAQALNTMSFTSVTDRNGRITGTKPTDISEEDGYDEDSDSPNMETVVGIVAGVIAGLVSLLVGYFTFRKRLAFSRLDERLKVKWNRTMDMWRSRFCSSNVSTTTTSISELEPPYEMPASPRTQPSSGSPSAASANIENCAEVGEMEAQFSSLEHQHEPEEQRSSQVTNHINP